MGRDCGDLALWAGLSVGAETILVPEVPPDIKDVAEKLKVVLNVEKHSIVMVAEGCMSGHECAEQLTSTLMHVYLFLVTSNVVVVHLV